MRLVVANKFAQLPKKAIPLAIYKGGVLAAVDDDAETAENQAIELPDGQEFQVLPEQREKVAQHIHIVAPSGCGKSTWAGNFAKEFQRDGGRVVCISADATDDPALPVDTRLPISEDLASVNLEDLVDPDEPQKLLLIFDDVEGVRGNLAKALAIFRKAAVERGRKLGISTLNIYHRGASGAATRDSLGEATGFVIFPKGGLSQNTVYMLKSYSGTPPEIIQLIRNRPGWGRSVFISNGHPAVAIGGRYAALLDPFLVSAVAKAEVKANKAAAAAN